jgi:fimbrial chaperone protein
MKNISKLVVCLLFITTISSFAHVRPMGTRIITSSNLSQVKIINDGQHPFAVFVSIYNSKKDGDLSKKKTKKFIAEPYTFQLSGKGKSDKNTDAGNVMSVRLIKVPKYSLPKEVESLFYLETREAPIKEKNDETKLNKKTIGGLKIAINTIIKFIYRPKGISIPTLSSNRKEISYLKQSKGIEVVNNGPHILNAAVLIINDNYKIKAGVVMPYSAKLFIYSDVVKTSKVDKSHSNKTKKTVDLTKIEINLLELKYVNDYGGVDKINLELGSGRIKITRKDKIV